MSEGGSRPAERRATSQFWWTIVYWWLRLVTPGGEICLRNVIFSFDSKFEVELVAMLLKYNLIVSTSSHKQVSTDGHDGWPSVHYFTFSYISSSSTYTAVTLGGSEELQTM